MDVDAIAHLGERIDALQATVRELSEQNAKLADERERYRTLYLQMLELNQKLERGLFGQKAEKLPPDQAQLTLTLLAALLGDRAGAEPPAEALQEIGPHSRRKPTGRKPLPENLPRIEIELLPDEVKRAGLDAFVKIGEEVSEVVERRPASLVAVRITRPKFVRVADRAAQSVPARVLTAEPLELPIPRAGSQARGGWPTRSCAAGRITCRCTGSRPSTPARVSSWRAPPSVAGTRNSSRWLAPWSTPCGITPLKLLCSALTPRASWCRPRSAAGALISGSS